MQTKKREPTTRINVVLPSAMVHVLRAMSKQQRRGYSSIIREILEDELGVKDTVANGGGFIARDDD